MKRNISSVIADGLCTGCGTCAAICPKDSINMLIDTKKGVYTPRINLDRCNNCGICMEACPGSEFESDKYNLRLFGSVPEDDLLGNYIGCYIAHSKDNHIRYASASGGMVTTLLIFALEKGMIDGAIVTRMKRDSPLEPESFIARTKEDIIEASKSKYCPVPANLALREVLKAKDGEHFAMVGLPCHIQGLRKAQSLNKKLQERVTLCFGLLCAHTDSFLATEFMIDYLKMDRESIKAIDYRGNGWPGSMSIESKDGNTKRIPFKDYINIFHSYNFFTPRRCLMCNDATCEFSDLSFGDAWDLSEKKDQGTGSSIIISRTKKAEKFLNYLTDDKKAEIKETEPKIIVMSQRGLIYTKKIGLKLRADILRSMGKKVPSLGIGPNKTGILLLFGTMIPFINTYISYNRYSRMLLKYVPLKIISFYGKVSLGFVYLWSNSCLKKDKEVDKYGKDDCNRCVLCAK